MSGHAEPQGESVPSPVPKAVFALPWLCLAIVVCLQLLPRITSRTMFFDGLIYSSIARNMSQGVGSFWHPSFSKTLFPSFSEHPPLMIWVEAFAFLLLGDSIWVEKGVSLLLALASGLILAGIWRQVNRDEPQFRRALAIPLVFALVAGRLDWAYANNMLENMLIVFTSLAIYLVVKADGFTAGALFPRAGFMVGAGIATGLAVLTKGPVGLFPLAAPGICWIVFRKAGFRRVVTDTLIMLTVIGVIFAILWQFPEPRAYMQRYLDNQLLSSLSGARGANGGGWNAVRTLLRVNFYPALLAVAIVLSSRYLTSRTGESVPLCAERAAARFRRGIFFLFVALSASVPLLVSPRIHSFYFNPSLPYFASALALWCMPAALHLLGALSALWLRRLTALLACGLVVSVLFVATGINKPGSDAVLIGDAEKIARHICPDKGSCTDTVIVCDAVWSQWQLHAYLQRHHKISLANTASTGIADGRYMLADRDCTPALPAGYSEIDLDLAGYRLMAR